MKRFLLLLLAITSILGLKAETNDSNNTCHFGITFEVSNNPNWGYGEPVILTVEPNSPADNAGILPGDIIMEINGKATYLRNYQTISSWLFNNNSDVAIFTIRNLNSYFKEYELPRQCRSPKAISEAELATSFSQYSVENTQERAFVLPLNITTNKEADYSDYHTFSFMKAVDAPAADVHITKALENALLAKGMVLDNQDPDILIQTSYSYKANPKYVANPRKNKTWRYDANKKIMVELPLLSGDNPRAGSEGQFMMELNIRLFDKKYLNPEKATQIWEANITEYATAAYSLEEYIDVNAPLIMMQFPYAKDRSSAKYVVSFKKYTYTGICYNMDDMKTVTDVDRNSPAYLVGIKGGYVIQKINNEKFNYSKSELMNGYKRFIIETMKYRNQNTKFTDASGYPDCMYWNTINYSDVKKALSNSLYTPAFSYLYNFENYISDNAGKSFIIEALRNGKKATFTVKPEIRSSITLRAL